MSEEEKSRDRLTSDAQGQQQQYYGTFQGVANYYPPPPAPPPHLVVGFPQPVAPHRHGPTTYYAHGYQNIEAGYGIVEGRPVREERLPCCGLGMGWFLFLVGFFLGGIPWYLGSFILLCVRVDYREKPGYVACLIASILAMIALTLGATRGSHSW